MRAARRPPLRAAMAAVLAAILAVGPSPASAQGAQGRPKDARQARPPADGGVAARADAYARRIGLRLPADARAEFADWTTGLDDSARIAFTLPDASWAALRAELGATALEPAGSFRFGPGEEGWHPGRSAKLLSEQLRWRDGLEVLNLGAAPAGAGRTRVFVFWHQL